MIDETYFEKIDNNLKAYIFGLIVFNIQSIQYDEENNIASFDVSVNTNDMIYNDMNNIEEELIKISDTATLNHIDVQNPKIVKDICRHIGDISHNENNIDITHIINNNTKEHVIEILKAYIDKYGTVIPKNTYMYPHMLPHGLRPHLTPIVSSYDKCQIMFTSESNQSAFAKFFGIPYTIMNTESTFILQYTNVNVVDLIGHFYAKTNKVYDNTFFKNFETILGGTRPILKYVKVTEDAVEPTKANYSDVGYDLTATGIGKKINTNTILCNTGIKLDIPLSYYVEIVPRSSLIKSGYMLANSVGIIDCSYKGELMIALIKVDPDAPELVFPYKCCQLIMRRQVFSQTEETSVLELSSRDQGGFGSSG